LCYQDIPQRESSDLIEEELDVGEDLKRELKVYKVKTVGLSYNFDVLRGCGMKNMGKSSSEKHTTVHILCVI